MKEKPLADTARGGYSTELELTQAAGRGDVLARRLLVEQLLDPLYRTVSYLSGPGREGEDLLQSALMEVLRSVSCFRGECSLRYWADRIAVRTAMHQIAKQHRRRRLRKEAAWEDAEEAPGWDGLRPLGAPSIEEEVGAVRIRQRLSVHLQKLSPERRLVLVLHHAQGYSVDEIAEMTGAPKNTVRGRLREGRRLLRKRILTDPVLREWGLGRP